MSSPFAAWFPGGATSFQPSVSWSLPLSEPCLRYWRTRLLRRSFAVDKKICTRTRGCGSGSAFSNSSNSAHVLLRRWLRRFNHLYSSFHQGAPRSVRTLHHRANLLQRTDVAAIDTEVLRDRFGVERVATTRGRDLSASVDYAVSEHCSRDMPCLAPNRVSLVASSCEACKHDRNRVQVVPRRRRRDAASRRVTKPGSTFGTVVVVEHD